MESLDPIICQPEKLAALVQFTFIPSSNLMNSLMIMTLRFLRSSPLLSFRGMSDQFVCRRKVGIVICFAVISSEVHFKDSFMEATERSCRGGEQPIQT